MTLAKVESLFPIEDPHGSVRIFFLRSHVLDVWHLCDASLWKPDGKSVVYGALHGGWVYPHERCDTVLQVKLVTKDTDRFCARCIEEYELAKDIIQRKRLLKFE